MTAVLVKSLSGNTVKIKNVRRPARGSQKIEKNMYVIKLNSEEGVVYEARGRCPRREDVKIIGFIEKILK